MIALLPGSLAPVAERVAQRLFQGNGWLPAGIPLKTGNIRLHDGNIHRPQTRRIHLHGDLRGGDFLKRRNCVGLSVSYIKIIKNDAVNVAIRSAVRRQAKVLGICNGFVKKWRTREKSTS